MRQDEETKYSTSEFLSPKRSSPKKRISIFGRHEGGGACLTPKQAEKSHFQHVDDVDSDDKKEGARRTNLGALLSPRLEKRLSAHEKRKSLLSPLSVIRTSFRLSSASKNSPKKEMTKSESDDDDDSEDESDNSDSEGDSDNEVEKVATENDMLLLLCRELELITGESDEEYDNDDDDDDDE